MLHWNNEYEGSGKRKAKESVRNCNRSRKEKEKEKLQKLHERDMMGGKKGKKGTGKRLTGGNSEIKRRMKMKRKKYTRRYHDGRKRRGKKRDWKKVRGGNF